MEQSANTVDEFVARIIQHPDLPAPGKTWMHIKQAIESDADVSEIARIVERDPSLTAQLLAIANSALMSGSRISTVTQAIMRIGVSTTYTLSLAREMVSKYQQGKSRYFDYAGFWLYSVAMGSTARLLVRQRPVANLSADEAFVLALLSPIGWLCLAEAIPALFTNIGLLEKDLPLPIQHLSGIYLSHIGVPENICVRLLEPTIAEGENLTDVGRLLEDARKVARCLVSFRQEPIIPPKEEVAESITVEFNQWKTQLVAS